MKSYVATGIIATIAIFGGGSSSSAFASDAIPRTGSFPSMTMRNLDGDSISFLCALGLSSFVDESGNLLVEPLTDYEYVDGVLDFAANETGFDAYDNQCKSLGGHTVTTTITYSNGCASALTFPLNSVQGYTSCLAPACIDQDQIDAYVATYIMPVFLIAYTVGGVDVSETAGCSVTSTSTTYGDR